MNANRIVREAAEQAMITSNVREVGLAHILGCSEKSVRKILDEEPVKMVQDQYVRLLILGKKIGRTSDDS